MSALARRLQITVMIERIKDKLALNLAERDVFFALSACSFARFARIDADSAKEAVLSAISYNGLIFVLNSSVRRLACSIIAFPAVMVTK